MPDRRRRICTCCGGHRDVVGELSWSGLCKTCYTEIVLENVDGIHTKTGYPHLRRLKGMREYLEREVRQMAANEG